MMAASTKRRLGYLTGGVALLIIEVLIALYVRDGFVRPYLGDVLVVILLHCLVRTLFPTGVQLLPLYLFLLAAAVVLWFVLAVGDLRQGSGEEARRQLEEAIRRAAVTCYANEGIYPPDLAYLQQHYGIRIDEDNYVVHYEGIASNLMPDITVLEIQ